MPSSSLEFILNNTKSTHSNEPNRSKITNTANKSNNSLSFLLNKNSEYHQIIKKETYQQEKPETSILMNNVVINETRKQIPILPNISFLSSYNANDKKNLNYNIVETNHSFVVYNDLNFINKYNKEFKMIKDKKELPFFYQLKISKVNKQTSKLVRNEYIQVPPFICTLNEILEIEDPKIIRWTECGNFIEILDSRLLSEKILPKYFQTNNYRSFQRQLNYFGFHKEKRILCKNIYGCPFFKRDHPENMKYIKKSNSTKSRTGYYIHKKIADNWRYSDYIKK